MGNDIISFRVGKGVAPDSIYDDEAFAEKYMRGMGDDFDCTRDLSRWDGFTILGSIVITAADHTTGAVLTGAGTIHGVMAIMQDGTIPGLIPGSTLVLWLCRLVWWSLVWMGWLLSLVLGRSDDRLC